MPITHNHNNRVVSSVHHHIKSESDAEGSSSDSCSGSEESEGHDPREFSSGAWSRSRMVKQKQPVTSSVHDEVHITPFVIDSADRDILNEDLFCFRIGCTPTQESMVAPPPGSGSSNPVFQEAGGCTILFNITDVKAIHCTSIVMPKYDFLHTVLHNGNTIEYENSNEIMASLDIMPATHATNARTRQAFNIFYPDLYDSPLYRRYLPQLPEYRFLTPINYLHGMQFSVHPYNNVHPKCVSTAAEPAPADQSGGAATYAVKSPDVEPMATIAFSIEEGTLTFSSLEEIDTDMLRVGSVISVQKFVPNLGEASTSSELQFLRFLSDEFLVPRRHHVVVAISDDSRSVSILLEVPPSLLDVEDGVIDPLSIPFYILNQSMQYRVYFQVEHNVHMLSSKTAEH